MRTLPVSLAAAALLAAPFVPTVAHAATTDTTAAFCAQLQTSQSAITAIAPSTPNRLTLIAAEWSKIARFAPAAVKTDVNAIAAAYKAAGSQDAATQKKTLTGIVKSAQAVTAFTAKSCNAGGGDGDGPGGPGGGDFQAQFAKLRDCVTKKGGKLPELNQGGGQPPQGGGQGQGRGQGGGPFGNLDAKTQTVLDACQKELGFGGGRGGFGGGAGGRNNPQIQACLKKKGITLPAAKAGERPTFDAKTQAAMDACRKELGLPAGGQGRGNGGPNANVPPSTVKA